MSAQWAPDGSSKSCRSCKRGFTLVLRRHHCRVCGQLFCDDCSNRKLPIPHYAIVRKPGQPTNTIATLTSPTALVRVCLDCWAAHKNGFQRAAPSSSSSAPLQGSASPPPVAQQPHGHRQLEAHADAPVYANSAPQINFPPGEYFEGPAAPQGAGPLPAFPAKNAVQRNDLVGMTAMAFNMMHALKANRNDPHLSAEDNAVRLAHQVDAAGGFGDARTQTQNALRLLEENHLPEGLAGFVVIEPPAAGTLGAAHGLVMMDLIYGYENVLMSGDTKAQQFAGDMRNAFVAKGSFDVLVYNFGFQRHRKVTIMMPYGKPNAILGIVSAQLPTPAAGANGAIPGVVEPSLDIYVKAWYKHGNMYVSAGANAVPLYADLTSENCDLYAKVSRFRSGMWITTNDYHPIYNYDRLQEPLYVEAWRFRNGMLIRNGSEYAPLPPERMSVAQSNANEAPILQHADQRPSEPIQEPIERDKTSEQELQISNSVNEVQIDASAASSSKVGGNDEKEEKGVKEESQNMQEALQGQNVEAAAQISEESQAAPTVESVEELEVAQSDVKQEEEIVKEEEKPQEGQEVKGETSEVEQETQDASTPAQDETPVVQPPSDDQPSDN